MSESVIGSVSVRGMDMVSVRVRDRFGVSSGVSPSANASVRVSVNVRVRDSGFMGDCMPWNRFV